jgi:predicted RND superfamily exporter protein
MNRDELLNTLQSLHDELESTPDVDQQTRQMLQTVTADIRDVLDQDGESANSESPESVSERLRETLIEFEARHPQIAGILERLTDGLANLGI